MKSLTFLNGLLLIAACLIASPACDKKAATGSAMKGQSNTTFTFYGLAVDETGQPLEGAEFAIEIEAFPANWTFETRGNSHVFSMVKAKTGRDGRFAVEVSAHILRFKRVERAGYRHLTDLDLGNSRSVENTFYGVVAWSDLMYKNDAEHPAIYVFVKDGAREVSALPCRGGWKSYNGHDWELNEPAWPNRPSLKDVVQKRPTTQPQ